MTVTPTEVQHAAVVSRIQEQLIRLQPRTGIVVAGNRALVQINDQIRQTAGLPDSARKQAVLSILHSRLHGLEAELISVPTWNVLVRVTPGDKA